VTETGGIREALKTTARFVALVVVLPALASYYVRRMLLDEDRAMLGSTQALSFIPGVFGQYLRAAFLRRTLAHCSATVTVEFGTLFSQAGTRIDENVYIGPMCHIGLAHLQRDVLIGAAVHIPSGPHTHGIADAALPIREQPGQSRMITIGAGSWVGSAAVVMADVGAQTVIGAGSVVTKPIPDAVVAAGAPAKVVRSRFS
jgi:acetyltransferase-like isoleucine patch superfamily enzyme